MFVLDARSAKLSCTFQPIMLRLTVPSTMAAPRKPTNFRLAQVVAVVFYLSRGVTVADECVKVDPCTCKTKTREVNLHTLDTVLAAGNPRFKDVPSSTEGTTYSYNPCSDFTEGLPGGSCAGVAACQIQGPSQYSLGSQSSVLMSGDPDGTLVFQYSSTEQRVAKVKITCDYGTTGQLTAEGENPEKTYTFTLKTSLACPPYTRLSVGSVLVILHLPPLWTGFFVLLIIYFIGGILFLRFVRKAQGAEMIPNYEFWTDFPFLIRDGLLFVFRGCKAESTYEKI